MTCLVLMLQLGKLDASYICASSGRVSSLYSMFSQTTDALIPLLNDNC